MAVREQDFQSELIKEFNSFPNGYAHKVSEKFSSGVPDINVALEGKVAWIELKFCKRPIKSTTPLHIEMTANQRLFLKNFQRAGGNAGWALCVKNPDRTWSLYAGTGHKTEQALESDLICVRKVGHKWDIKSLMERICAPNPAPLSE